MCEEKDEQQKPTMGAIKELMRSKNPAELVALLRYAKKAKSARVQLTKSLDPHWRYAYDALCDVSRSFALVIMELGRDLRDPVCVFYLVLRALDTVEDDTSVNAATRLDMCRKFWTFLPAPSSSSSSSVTKRVRLSSHAPSTSLSMPVQAVKHESITDQQQQHQQLMNDDDFDDGMTEAKHSNSSSSSIDEKTAIEDKQNNNTNNTTDKDITDDYDKKTTTTTPWSSSKFGKGAEKELCERFPEILQCYLELNCDYQTIIRDITRRMGAGMGAHINDVSCNTTSEYDLYCHYVAGLVGYGLTDLFIASSRESLSLSHNPSISNSMGLFLQKTNIIRDYLEDIEEGRTFWPADIWTCYASSLNELKQPNNRKFALAALNHMVTNALDSVPHCLQYMATIQSRDVFNFVAIPQVMAIATLNEVYNNGAVFEGVVKLRRAETAHLVLQTKDMNSVYSIFFKTARSMLLKVAQHDPNARRTKMVLRGIVDLCVPHVPTAPNLIIPNLVSIVLFSLLSWYVLKRREDHFDGAVFTWRSAGGIMEPLDMLAVGALFLVCMYMFGFFLLPYMSKLQQDDWRRLERLREQSDIAQQFNNNNSNNNHVNSRPRRVVELDEDGYTH